MSKNVFISALIALLVSVGSILGMYSLGYLNSSTDIENNTQAINNDELNRGDLSSPKAIFTLDKDGNAIPLSFEKVASKVLDAVVGVKTTYEYQPASQYRQLEDPFKYFREFFDMDEFQSPFEQQPRKAQGAGSGVIISEDGYIVTNNHVIQNASEISVTLHDNREYEARVIGKDPSTDLALLKIEDRNLPTVKMVNSDDVRVGEWVLAVGNPFNLSSTVTAGIVSAKARNINILENRYAVESFIQTDAAINKGNSGGALVNLEGGLVGINSAIFSPSGAYSGYGFAIPSNLVNKVIRDLLDYGTVQRGFLGITMHDIDSKMANKLNLDEVKGVYIAEVSEGSAADKAGLEEGSVVVEIDGKKVNSSPELQELVARKRPGDALQLAYLKDGKKKNIEVILENKKGTTDVVTKEMNSEVLGELGVTLRELSPEDVENEGLEGGVQVEEIDPNGAMARMSRIAEGFIITKVEGRDVNSVDEFIEALSGRSGSFMVEGKYPGSDRVFYYALGLRN